MGTSSRLDGAGGREGRPKRRDRHGRGFRGPVIRPHLPGHRTRREAFDDAVLDAAEPLLEKYPRRLEHLEIAVEEVPPVDPAPWEPASVALGRFVPPGRDHPPRVIVYRRPITTRCQGDAEIGLLVRQVLAEQIGAMLGIAPEDVDPGAWGDAG